MSTMHTTPTKLKEEKEEPIEEEPGPSNIVEMPFFVNLGGNIYVSLHLRVQNAVPAQPCVGKLGISLVLLNFLHCNFRLWFKTP